MNSIEYFGSVNQDGILHIRNRKMFDSELKQLAGKEVEIVVRKKKKNRSQEQSRWYWACVTIIANELGYRKDEMHEVIKFKFLKGELVDTKSGEVFEYLKSTASLSTTEFTVFMDSLIQWSLETFNIVLPLPNTQLEVFQ